MGLTIKGALALGKSELSDIEYANIEANILLCHTLGVDRIYLMINEGQVLDPLNEAEFRRMLSLRKAYMPIAYIVGFREFYGRDFICKEEVLVPRTDTETLIEETLALMNNESLKGLEIGVGTGIISVTLLCENQKLFMDAVDISDYALELAKENAYKHKVESRINIRKSDLFKSIDGENYDFVVSNPPYIETKEINGLMPDVKNYEPHLALDGMEDGLYFYREIGRVGLKKIKSKGFIVFEIGYNQGETVPDILETLGYMDIKIVKDLQGNDRVVTARTP
ncbi:MAG: peptide chain release factor N(5)-glutamine methyltransferase [Filifactoraceae bacterium]